MEKNTTFNNLNVGDIIKILCGSCKNQIGRVIDMNEEFNQVDVKLASGNMRHFEFEDVEIQDGFFITK